jgi:hypothetical protein
MASAIVIQTSVNCVAIYPNNHEELPQFELDFLKEIPTTWEETQFIVGYPTQHVVLARRTGDKWYVAGLNGTQEKKVLTLQLPMLAGKTVRYYTDCPKKKGELLPASELKTLKIDTKIVNHNNPSMHILFSICFILIVSPLKSETTYSIIFIYRGLPNLEIGTH